MSICHRLRHLQDFGLNASIWSEYPDNLIPGPEIYKLGDFYYTTDSGSNISKIDDAGVASFVSYNSSQITGAYSISEPFLNEMIFAVHLGMGTPSKLYRIGQDTSVTLLHTNATVANTDYYGIFETIAIGQRRSFTDFAMEFGAGTSYQFFTYGAQDSSLTANLASLPSVSYTASLILSESEQQRAILWQGRYYFNCQQTEQSTALCSESQDHGDRRVEVSDVYTMPDLSGDKLFYEKYQNNNWNLHYLRVDGVSVTVPVPDGVSLALGSAAFAVNGFLIFAGESTVHGTELFISDGLTSKLLIDIKPGVASSDPQVLGIAGDELVVQVANGLWDRGLVFLDISGLRP